MASEKTSTRPSLQREAPAPQESSCHDKHTFDAYFDDDLRVGQDLASGVVHPMHQPDPDLALLLREPAESPKKLSAPAPSTARTWNLTYVRKLIVTLLATFAFSTFLFAQRHDIAYALAAPTPPQVIDAFADLDAGQLAQNQYVRLRGVTEHRGIQQERIRGLVPSRKLYWYFRLLGAGSLFIEAPADAERFGFTTEVSVEGRIIDPMNFPTYRDLVDHYFERFPRAHRRPDIRILQVGAKPGEGLAPYLILFALLLGCLGLNIRMLVGLVGVSDG